MTGLGKGLRLSHCAPGLWHGVGAFIPTKPGRTMTGDAGIFGFAFSAQKAVAWHDGCS